MPRPKKAEGAADEIKQEEPVEIDIELKACPNCGSEAKPPYKDGHGLWRCSCSHEKCNFWDSRVYFSAEEAALGWNAAGGKNKPEE